jgi:hypothetical protein
MRMDEISHGGAGFSLRLGEDGFVWLSTILEDGSAMELGLGEKAESCGVMQRFLRAVDFGEYCGTDEAR